MKKIPLTQGKVALVDDGNFEYLSQFKWHAAKDKHIFYAKRNITRADGSQRTLKLHQVILPPKKGFITDHENGDGLDCQKQNLRYATRLQNARNRITHVKRKTGKYKGVYWDRNKWRVIIKRKISIGRFDSEVEAAKAYDSAAKKLFGKFACLNFK